MTQATPQPITTPIMTPTTTASTTADAPSTASPSTLAVAPSPPSSKAENRDPRRWVRRGIAIPMIFLFATIFAALFPIALPLAFVVDLFRRKKFALTRCTLFFTGYLVGEVAFFIVLFLQWVLAFGGLTKAGQARLTRWAHPMGNAWGNYCDRFGRWCFSVRQEVTGTEVLAARGPVLALLRHASVADNLLAPSYFGTTGAFDLRYVAKFELQNDPIFDVIGNRIGACFVRRGTGNADREIAAVVSLLDGMNEHEAIIMYPEGTRFSVGKRLKILASIEKRGDAAQLARATALEHVLPPNLGGPVALLDRATSTGKKIDAIFCMHAGYEGAATFADLVQGRAIGRTVRIHFERVPFDQLPRGREAIAEWFYARWEKLDAWVGQELPAVLEKAKG